MVNILNQHHKECTDRILLLYTSSQFLFRISMFPLCHKSFMKFLPWYTIHLHLACFFEGLCWDCEQDLFLVKDLTEDSVPCG